MRRDRLRLAAAVGLQLLILALVPARQVLAAWRGQEITLATAPVDPGDPFSGAYTRLAYEVERPPAELAPAGAEEGDTVYLVVERAVPAWRLVAVTLAPPEPAPGRAALRATWRRGRAHLESASRLYLPAEKAQAADQAVREQWSRYWLARDRERIQALAARRPEPEPPPQPLSFVDLKVDGSGHLRVLRLRVGDQTFGE